MASPTAGFGSSGASSSSTVTSSGVSGLSIFSQHKPSTALSQFQGVVHQDPVQVGRHAFASYTSKAYLGDQPPDFDYYMLKALATSNLQDLVSVPLLDYYSLNANAFSLAEEKPLSEISAAASVSINHSSLIANPSASIEDKSSSLAEEMYSPL